LIETQFEDQPAKVPWNLRDTIWGTLVAFGLFIGLMVAFVFLPVNITTIGLILGLGELIFLLPVWWFSVRKYGIGWRSLGLGGFDAKELAIAFGLILIGYTVIGSYGMILGAFGLETPDTLTPVLEAGVGAGWLVLGAAIVAPVIEEIFFRGFIFAGLKTRFDWKVAAVISAIIFALNHLEPLTMFPIFVLGLLLAYMYQRSKSIWPAILMHTFINTCALITTYAMYSGAVPSA